MTTRIPGRQKLVRWPRAAALVIMALSGTLGGCASFTNPVANGIAVRRLPPELLGESKNEKLTIPLTYLRQKPPEVYRLEPDFRYLRVEDYRMTDANGVRTGTLTENGTYARARDTISFTRTLTSGTCTTHGAIEAARLVMRYPAQGVTLVYDQTPP